MVKADQVRRKITGRQARGNLRAWLTNIDNGVAGYRAKSFMCPIATYLGDGEDRIDEVRVYNRYTSFWIIDDGVINNRVKFNDFHNPRWVQLFIKGIDSLAPQWEITGNEALAVLDEVEARLRSRKDTINVD